jgi:hypothetical protein
MTQIPVVKKIKSFEMLKAAWEETKHPRDESGEFAPEGGGSKEEDYKPDPGKIKEIDDYINSEEHDQRRKGTWKEPTKTENKKTPIHQLREKVNIPKGTKVGAGHLKHDYDGWISGVDNDERGNPIYQITFDNDTRHTFLSENEMPKAIED